MSADDFLADAATRRQVMVQRVSRGMTSELEGLLEEMREEIAGRISEAGTDFQRARLGSLLTSVDSIIKGKTDSISQSLRDRIAEFTKDELDFQKQTLDQVLTDPSAMPNSDQVLSAVTSESTDLINGDAKQSMTINQMLGVLSGSNSKQLKSVISTGFIAGDTTSQITQRLSQKIRGRSRAQVRAVVQTSLNHAAGVARQKFAEENKDKLGGEKYLATLDSSTTVTCAGLDGNIYEVGTGPRPPLHYNCRSLRVAVPREDSVLAGLDGTRPAVGSKGVQQVSSKKTFSGWLNDQPDDFQRDFFSKVPDGNAKYQLFKKGGLDAKDFIDPDGVQISLSELKQKHSLAWQKVDVSETVPQPTREAVRIGQRLPVGAQKEVEDLFVAKGKARDAAGALGTFPEEVNISPKTKSKSFYRPLNNSITSANSTRTFTHEYGHFVDYNAGSKKTNLGLFPLSTARGMGKAIEQDAKNLGIDPKVRGVGATKIKKKAEAIKKEIFTEKEVPLATQRAKDGSIIKQTFTKTLRATEDVQGLSDLYDAGARGSFHKLGFFGHGEKYYAISGSREKEAFANLFQMYDTPAYEVAKRDFPLTTQKFEEILDEIIEIDSDAGTN